MNSDVLRDIPTEKSWETLSDPVIHAGGSRTLERFGRLFSSGEDGTEEGESLLLMLLGLHSFCHNTTHTFFHRKTVRCLPANNMSGNFPLR